VTELAKIRSSLERTKKTLGKISVTAEDVENRALKLDTKLSDIREAFQNSRGQKIRGEVDRTFRQVSKLNLTIEHIQVRCDRLIYKCRNLELDRRHSLSAVSRLASNNLAQALSDLTAEAQEIKENLNPFLKASTAWVAELETFSSNANWSYRIYLAIDRLRTGFDDLGLRDLLGLVYGPNTPPDHRRRALAELLSWGHTSNDAELIALSSAHMKAYWTSPDRYSANDRELVLRLEGLRQTVDFASTDSFVALLDASRRGTEDALLAGANLVAGAKLASIYEFGQQLQIQWINAALALRDLEPVSLNKDLGAELFDQLDCLLPEHSAIDSALKVSVIMPAFNSAPWLPTAVRGLLNQTWRNLEVIIVDDCSSDETLAVANSLAENDSRIRVLANKVNQGAYASRNYGLQVAHGNVITVHDADDWSHPRKIERQMLAMQAQENTVANMSRSVRIDPQSLHFFAQYGREILRQNSSSLLFKRNPVFTELGYWDEVKFGADTEYHHRINAKFGLGSAPTINAGLLSFTRFHTESLTGGGKNSTVRGIIGARRDYVRKFSDWHDQMKLVDGGLYLERAVKKRPFVIPTSSAGSEQIPVFDFVVVANLAIQTPWLELVYKKAKAKSKLKSTVAVVHVPSILKPNAQPSPELELLLAKGQVSRLDREHAAGCTSLVIHSDALQARNELLPDLRPEAVTLVFGAQESEAQLVSALQLAQDYFAKAPRLMADSVEAQASLRDFGLGEVPIWKSF
jgi:glycosyltransferase involved in cell wall biosynthesis